ncbi:MAG: DMT family transporter [Rhodobacter sp.]|nr:DMT family transporter [Paracoccaceae bacterium]MCC0074964.1 DMT family transporter [Rhodobacter sp.]
MSSLRGPSLMVASMAAFALEDALIKGLAAHVPTGQIALFLGAGGTLVFWLVTRARGEPLFVAAALRGAVLVRNLAEVVAAMCMILSMALVPLSVVSAILQAMPLAVTLGAALFLGEPVGWRRWGAILVGFAGVLMILRPGSAGFDQMALLPLAAVVGLTVRDIATKKVHDGVSSLQLSGWGFVAVLPSGILLFALRGETPVMPSALEWAMLVGMVTVGILGYAMLVLATRAGDIASTTPFRYSRLVFAMLLGVLIFGERPDAWTLVGSAVVVGAGLYALMREIQLRRR